MGVWSYRVLLLIGACLWSAVGSAQHIPETGEQLSLSFAPLVAETSPAVVNIFTSTEVTVRRPVNPFFNDPFFERFFGDRFGPGRSEQRRRSSLGSGVIVRESGLVVTNHHVIAGADTVRVVLKDGREFEAEIVLSDERTDLALLQLPRSAEPLPSIPMGDSDGLLVGDLVLAIGNPFGVGQTVTLGIVSAVARPAQGVSDFNYFIQTDAAINPGNSGGALVAVDGTLVGINTAIYSRDGGSLGIGFAVPVTMLRAIMESVDRGRPLVRPWLGASLQEMDVELAEALGLDRARGAVVTDLHPDSPADRAGLEPGDVVVGLAGIAVATPAELEFRLAVQTPDTTALLEILRSGDLLDLSLPISLPPETPLRDVRLLEGANPLAGAVIANLSPALIQEIGYPHGLHEGVVVLQIQRGSPAARLGLEPMDRFVSVNRSDITDTGVLADLVRGSRAPWEVRILRGDRRLETVIER